MFMLKAISLRETTLKRGSTLNGAKPPGFARVIRLLS